MFLRLWMWLRTIVSRNVGRAGEIAAQLYLRDRGLYPVARNWRGARGELDVVLVTGENELVIAEVKTTGGRPEDAWDRIDPAKEACLAATTSKYLARNGIDPSHPLRFDVVLVIGDPRVLRKPLRFLWSRGVF